MATKKGQRIGILIITIVMTVGTLGSFLGIILQNKNSAADQTDQAAAYEQYKKQVEEQAAANVAASKPLVGYSTNTFDKSGVKSLGVEILKQGDGAVLKPDSSIKINYFGWTSDGKIFDSSNKNGTATPIELSLSGVIAGWTEGLTGVKVGSVVKLTIPSDKAYGSTGSEPTIGPDEPLQFIVDVLELK